MRSEGHSIFLNKSEAWTLHAFTGEGSAHSKVHFRICGDGKLLAGATSGKSRVFVECKAAKADVIGKWSLDRDLIEQARTSVKKPDQSLRIDILGEKGKPRAYLIHTDSNQEISHIEWPNAAEEDVQLTLDNIIEGIEIPNDRNYTGGWGAFDPFALNPLRRLALVVDGQPITWYPAETDAQPFRFEVHHETGIWRAAICTERVIGPGGEREVADDDDDAPGRADRQVRMDLDDRAKGNGLETSDRGDGIIDDEEAERLKAEQPLATEKRKQQRRVKPSQMKAPAE